jgi:integrase/recombinase XerC
MSTDLVRLPPADLPARPIPGFESDLLAAFLASLRPLTLKGYLFDLGDFARWIERPTPTQAVEKLLSLDGGHANALVLQYRSALTARGLASATIGRRLAALRSVTKLARTLGRIAWSLEIRSPPLEARRDVRGPDRDGWRKLWKAAKGQGDGRQARRDRAIISLLYDLALRRTEVVTLDLADVDFEGLSIGIVGKGHTERQRLTLPKPTLNALADWVAVRGTESGAMFTRTDRGRPSAERLGGDSIARLVARLGTLAKLARPLRAHGLRHASITAALDLGHDIREVRKFSRHIKIDTVIQYDDNREDSAGKIAKRVAGDRR